LTYTTKRRSNEINIEKYWLVAPNLAFFITGLLILIVESNYIYWLALLPNALFLLILSQKEINKKPYILGYYGPIDFTIYQKSNQRSQRVEPTFSTPSSVQAINSAQVNVGANQHLRQIPRSSSNSQKTNNNLDFLELITNQFIANKRIAIIISAIVALMLFIITLNNSFFSPSQENAPEILEQASIVNEQTSHNNIIALPDDFSLMTTSYDGIVISWSADNTDKNTLWNIKKAQGDKSCQAITFNNKDKFRTLLVSVENTSTYFAEFSPLDTNKILKDMAFRSSFSLCGYKFSLKGSQAILGKKVYYSEKIDY
jgi:hypothetical protein